MPLYNGSHWAYIIRTSFLRDIDYYGRCLTERFLPSFGSIEDEAKQVADDYWNSPPGYTSEDTDPADVAEAANDAGLEFYEMMDGIRQGMVNMVTAGLWHIVEQKMLLLHRRELLDRREEHNQKLWTLKEATKRLAVAGINIEAFTTWSSVYDLRLVANTVKHADGGSCEELKVRRPEFFTRPSLGEHLPMDYLPTLAVFEPMMGDQVYVTPEHFAEFLEAVRTFFTDLADALEKVPRDWQRRLPRPF